MSFKKIVSSNLYMTEAEIIPIKYPKADIINDSKAKIFDRCFLSRPKIA